MAHLTKVLLAFGLAFALAGATFAQDHSRNWENGHVVVVTHVDVHAGMFNAYINDLNSVWRKFIEEQMKDGSIVNYGMYANAFARDDEPDLVLTVTYRDWAAFDRGPDYFEELSNKLAGGAEDMRQKGVDREALRKIGSSLVLQQIKFSDQE